VLRIAKADASQRGGLMSGGDVRLIQEISRNVRGDKTVSERNSAAPINTIRLVGQADGDVFGFLLEPAQGAFGAGHNYSHVILLANADLGRANQRPGTVAQFAIWCSL
jgi:hypothetical protein